MNRAALWALLAALCFGIAPMFEKLALKTINPLVAVFIRATVTALFIGVVLTIEGGWGQLADLKAPSWFFIVVSGLIGVLLAQVFYFQALQTDEVGRIVPIVGSYPLFAALLAAVFLGERLTPGRIFGTFLVFLGLLFLS